MSCSDPTDSIAAFASEPRLNTSSLCTYLDRDIDLCVLFDGFPIDARYCEADTRTVYDIVIIKDAVTKLLRRKTSPNPSNKRKKPYTQFTCNHISVVQRVLSTPHEPLDSSTETTEGVGFYFTHIKVWKNGKITIVGLQDRRHAARIVDRLIMIARDVGAIVSSRPKPPAPTLPPSSPHNDDDLISFDGLKSELDIFNYDFRVNQKLDRDKLMQLIRDRYGLKMKTESSELSAKHLTVYYMHNKPEFSDNGRCMCTNKCTNKGRADGDGNCSRISITVFQSGCILIRGKIDYDFMAVGYDFIVGLLETHRDRVSLNVGNVNGLPPAEAQKK